MPTSGSNRILIIDDNAAIHEDFHKVLDPKNTPTKILNQFEEKILQEKIDQTKRIQFEFEIDSAHQGKEGFDLVKKSLGASRPYAMAFVDVHMPPGWDGIETIEQIWAIDPQIQIAICTAYSEYSWEDITSRLGFTDKLLILKKPFDSIEIQQMAHCLVIKWNLNQKVKCQYDYIQHLLQEQANLTQVINDNNEMLNNKLT
jgi:CheY-like chemotaxis protein